MSTTLPFLIRLPVVLSYIATALEEAISELRDHHSSEALVNVFLITRGYGIRHVAEMDFGAE